MLPVLNTPFLDTTVLASFLQFRLVGTQLQRTLYEAAYVDIFTLDSILSTVPKQQFLPL